MKTECCGKIINTAFCPYCGEAVSSPVSLISYLDYELRLARLKEFRIISYLDENNEYHRERNRARNQGNLATVKIKIQRLEGWIKWATEHNKTEVKK